MTVAIAAGVVGLVVVLVAFYRDAPVDQRRRLEPDWDVLPDPGEVARTEFPLTIPGYDPATVEFHFDVLTRAYADLLASATPAVIARARHRAAVRRGIQLPADTAEAAPPAPGVHARPTTALAPLPGRGADDDALLAEAALADLDTQRRPNRT